MHPKHILNVTRFTSSNGSLSDSGISDGGTTSDGGLSERERRLGVLRRLAKQLESALAPGSEAMKSIAARMESAEAELKSLQNTCRDLIVRTATSHQQNLSSKLNDDKEIELSTTLGSDGDITVINNGSLKCNCTHDNNSAIKCNRRCDGNNDLVDDNNAKSLLSSSRCNQQHQVLENCQQAKNNGSLTEKSASLLQRQKNHKLKQRNKTTPDNDDNGDSSQDDKDQSNRNDRNNGHHYRSQNNQNNGNDGGNTDDDDQSDDDKDANRRNNNTYLDLLSNSTEGNDERTSKSRGQRRNRGRVWRVARIAVFMQLALITAFCIAYMMQPDCCENMNTYAMSFTPQLRYVRGPPPT